MTRYTIVVPVAAGDRTHYRRVGALFENVNRETGETWFRIDMDFPVGAVEMLAFPPRPRDGRDGDGADGGGAKP